MTNAPIYKSQVGNRPVGQTYVRNADTALSFGAGVGEAMREVGAAALNVRDAFALRDQLKSDTRVREGRERYREASRAPVAEARNATGLNAVPEGEKASERLERIRQEEAAKFTNPREREAFLASTEALSMSRQDDIYANATAQERQAMVDGFQAGVTGYQEDAIDHFDDDAKFEENLALAVEEQRRLGALTGVAPDTQARADEELVMETISNRAVVMAASDPEAAAQYIESETRLSAVEKQKVKDLLAPAVQGARIETWMSQFIKRGTGGAGGDFMSTTRQRESGGNDNAQNPNSTADGRYQYVDKTWNESVLLARNAGALPEQYANLSDAELQAMKMDPDLQEAVMTYDTARYEAVLSSRGIPVNNATMYMVHHFGMGAGPAVLATAAANPGASAKSVWDANPQWGQSWSSVVGANPGLSFNMTVGELQAYAGRHVGQGGATVEFDFAAAYSFAQTIEDPKDRAAFLAQVEAREATESARSRAAKGAVIDEASTRYFETGESELTLQQQMALGIDGTSAWRDMVAKNESGKLVTDMSVYSMLLEMQTSPNRQTREQFAAAGSIEGYINQLSQDDYRAMVTARAQVRSELEGVKMTEEQLKKNPEMAVPIKDEHRKAVGEHLDRVGIAGGAKNAQARAEAEYMMTTRLRQQMLDFYNVNGRAPEEAEIDDMIYAQTLQVTPGGMVSDPKMLFQFDTMADGEQAKPTIQYENIPTTERVELTRKLAAVLGRTPTPEEVATAFVNGTLVRGMEAPVPLDTFEPPMEVLAYGSALGMTEDELMQHWETYVNLVAAGQIDPVQKPFVPAN